MSDRRRALYWTNKSINFHLHPPIPNPPFGPFLNCNLSPVMWLLMMSPSPLACRCCVVCHWLKWSASTKDRSSCYRLPRHMAWYGWALTALWSGEHLSWGSKSIDSSLNLFMAIESQSGCRARESVFMEHIYRHLKGNLIDFFRCTNEDLPWQRNATICKLHMTNSIEGNWIMYSCKMVRSNLSVN